MPDFRAGQPGSGGGHGGSGGGRNKDDDDDKKKKKKKKAFGGWVPGTGNTDSVNALLTPGEFVVRKAQAQKFGPLLTKMNQPNFRFSDLPGMVSASSSSGGGSDGNTYNVVVNATTGANAEEIATIAVRKIKDLNNGKLKGRNQ